MRGGGGGGVGGEILVMRGKVLEEDLQLWGSVYEAGRQRSRQCVSECGHRETLVCVCWGGVILQQEAWRVCACTSVAVHCTSLLVPALVAVAPLHLHNIPHHTTVTEVHRYTCIEVLAAYDIIMNPH